MRYERFGTNYEGSTKLEALIMVTEMSPKGMYLLPPSLIEYNSSTIMTGAAPNKCQYISARPHSIISKNTDLPPFLVTYLLLYQLT